jgi:hypothetical protein
VPQDPGPARPAQLPPDRERDAGYRGEAFTRAAWLLGLVFVLGLALVAFVVLARRRRPPAA